MNDLNVIDRFMQAFISYIDAGFGLLGGDVHFLTATLIAIDITLAGLFWAMGGEDNVIGRFLRKILYVGAFAFILNSFSTLADIIFRSFAQAGLIPISLPPGSPLRSRVHEDDPCCTGSRHHAHSSCSPPCGGTAMAALSWTYPADQLIALRKAAEQSAAAAPIAEGLAVDSLHFNYRISGDMPAWRPLRAFDDGRQTFVEFPASIAVGEAPPLFIVGPAGEAELVNYRVRSRFYVVDRIFDAAELRLGTKRPQTVRIDRIDASIAWKGKRS